MRWLIWASWCCQWLLFEAVEPRQALLSNCSKGRCWPTARPHTLDGDCPGPRGASPRRKSGSGSLAKAQYASLSPDAQMLALQTLCPAVKTAKK